MFIFNLTAIINAVERINAMKVKRAPKRTPKPVISGQNIPSRKAMNEKDTVAGKN